MSGREGLARRVLANAGLLLLSTLAVLFATEVAFRTTSLGDRLGWSRIPPLGERLEGIGPKPPGTLRILGLGDSFTEYRDTDGRNYLRRVETLANAVGRPVEVVNLAQAGTGLNHYLETHRRHAARVAADVVVLGLFVGNDIRGFVSVSPAPLPGDRAGEDGASAAGGWIEANSAVVSTAHRLAKRVVPGLQTGTWDRVLAFMARSEGIGRRELRARLAEIDPEVIALARADSINPWDLALGVTQPDFYRRLLFPSGVGARHASDAVAALAVLSAEVEASGGVLIVVLLPSSVQVSGRYHPYYRRLGYRVGPGMLEETPLMRLLLDGLEVRGVRVVDVLPALRAESEADFFIPMDTHLDSEGQDLVARLLWERLETEGLLGPDGAGS